MHYEMASIFSLESFRADARNGYAPPSKIPPCGCNILTLMPNRSSVTVLRFFNGMGAAELAGAGLEFPVQRGGTGLQEDIGRTGAPVTGPGAGKGDDPFSPGAAGQPVFHQIFQNRFPR